MAEQPQALIPTSEQGVEPSDTASISEAMLPLYNDSNAADYLKYRVCFFSVKEALQLSGIQRSTLDRWRKNPAFQQLDTVEMPRLQTELSGKYLSAEFTRNFTLILRKDFEVLMKVTMHKLYPDKMEYFLTTSEEEWLSKIRQSYTPQQLAQIKQLAGEVKNDAFNFSDLVISFKRVEESGSIQIKK